MALAFAADSADREQLRIALRARRDRLAVSATEVDAVLAIAPPADETPPG